MAEQITTKDPEEELPSEATAARIYRILGPGLITGAADDDPSGIATYSQAGAQFGYALGWAMFLTYPLMAAVQVIAGRMGRTTGLGLSGVFERHLPRGIVAALVTLLMLANTINLGADLSAMADATGLLIGLPKALCLVAFTAFCVLSQTLFNYTRYVAILKWLTLSLLAYVATLAIVEIEWREFAVRLLAPGLRVDRELLTTLVAVLGTTISPYLLFWQAAQEGEEVRRRPERQPLRRRPGQGSAAVSRINVDTLSGMAFSNIVALAIMTTAAATLHKNGGVHIESSTQAAEALRPLAGDAAFALFTLGIVGTGLLAVPVLAGSAGYAVAEAGRWKSGLGERPKEAPVFYITLAAATAAGMLIAFLPLNPVRLLYWSAVINGVIVVPIMAAMMLLATRSSIMGKFAIRGSVSWLGWVTTVAMAAAGIVMIAFWFV